VSILSTGETLFLLSRSFDFDFFFDLSRDFDLFFLNFLSFERDRLRSRDLDGFDVLDRFQEVPVTKKKPQEEEKKKVQRQITSFFLKK
jgi:hypothetical protein